MAVDYKAKEKAVATECDGHWIRDDKWDVETSATVGHVRWVIEVKSEAMPAGLKKLWTILDDAWTQLTENWRREGRTEWRRLVVYAPTGTGVLDGFAMWREHYEGWRIAPYRKWLELYYRPHGKKE